MTEAAINAGITRDLYVSLGEAVDGDAWTIRIHIKPFIRWIWFGCLMMAFGGLLAASDRRYRAASRERSATTIGEATVIRSSAA
jgi:cytochrome c-type biogenesis protein CcmF